MKKEDLETLLRFLGSKSPGNYQSCPSCGKDDWLGCGIYSLLQTEGKDGPFYPTITVMPLAVLRCENCQHVELFAWLPIKEWGENNLPSGGDEERIK